MTTQTATPDGPILTVDGIPLKASLEKSLRQNKLRASILVAGPLFFLLLLFVFPIGDMLLRSVDDSLINRVLPTTLEEFEAWDKTSEPPEALYAAFVNDLKAADKIDVGKVSTRMNYAKPGWKSLVKRTARKIKKIEGPQYKEALIKIDKRWADSEFWLSLGIMKDRTLPLVISWNSVDRTYDFDKNIIHVDEERKVYNTAMVTNPNG